MADDISASKFGVARKPDPRYERPVNGLGQVALKEALQEGIGAIAKVFPPKTGIALFVFDFGEGGGIGYASNSERDDMVRTMKEWLKKQGEL